MNFLGIISLFTEYLTSKSSIISRNIAMLIVFFTLFQLSCTNEEKGDKEVEETVKMPEVEKVDCQNVVEWIRLRPSSKQCESDADCSIQTDGCCDTTSVNKEYFKECPRTCPRACPQDSVVGTQIKWKAICRKNFCDLERKEEGPSEYLLKKLPDAPPPNAKFEETTKIPETDFEKELEKAREFVNSEKDIEKKAEDEKPEKIETKDKVEKNHKKASHEKQKTKKHNNN